MADRTSKIILAKNVKMDRELKNVVNYNTSQMLNMLTTTDHFVAQSNTYSFIRNTGTIQTDFNYSQALQSNYIAFQNYDYSNKWFYAWIEDVIYKGEKNTEIKYKVDSFSTFNQDLNYENCFVVREHVNDDTIGLHTIPENIDIGDIIQEGDTGFITELRDTAFYMGLEANAMPIPNTGDGDGIYKFTGVTAFNKLVSGREIYIFKNHNDLSNFLHRMAVEDAVDFIYNLFVVPSVLFTETGLINDLVQHFSRTQFRNVDAGTTEIETFYWYTVKPSDTIKTLNLNVSKVSSFSGIQLKNNKCYCYPYNYLLVSNNVGQNSILKYEDFSTGNCQFDLVGVLSIGGSFKLYPKNYKGIEKNFDESLPLAKYPTCSWSSDAYTSWLTQNSANEYANAGSNIISSAMAGGAAGGIYGAVISGGISAISEISGLSYTFDKAKLIPPNSVGANTGNVNWAMGGNNFFFRHMRAKNEYLKIIDDYFSKFGYKVNRLKTPNITGRAYFNYVEVGASEDACFGSIPEIYADEIIKAFRKGITIWHDDSKIGDYTVSNTIV